MLKRLAWEKNILIAHGWKQERIRELEERDDETPVEYLVGEMETGGLTLSVNPTVLIPRVETEELVHLTSAELVKILAEMRVTDDQIVAVEVGTGSGFISLSLANTLQQNQLLGKILAMDISSEALAVAQKNGERNNLSERVSWRESDLLESVGDQLPTSSEWILVANLPYIPTAQLRGLPASVKQYEPELALDGGDDGFAIIAHLLLQASKLLHPPSKIFLEIDPSHASKFNEQICGYQWQVISDFNQFPRYAIGQLRTKS